MFCRSVFALVILAICSGSFGHAQGPLRERLGKKLAEAKRGTTDLKRVTWKIGTTEREALVHVPTAKKDEKRPLVIALHGHGGRAEYSARKFTLHTLWPEAVCIYPQGLPTAVPVIDPQGTKPGWQKYVGDQEDRDLKFFDELLKTALADYQIDEQRIYVTGHSNGGYFTYVLNAARGDKLAAIAPVAAGINPRDAKSYKALPTFHVAGEQDKIVRFALQERSIDRRSAQAQRL
jgi:polyhydroxybutyrate depolymerase